MLFTLSLRGADIGACSAARGAGGHWSWREIDGRRCWYQGDPGRSKSLLRWSLSSPRPSSAAVDRPEIVTPESSDLGADSTPAPDELTVRAQRNAEMLWQATAEDQERAFTCCWPDSEPASPLISMPLPLKIQDRVPELPRATPPARTLWPFMFLPVIAIVLAGFLTMRRLR